ncbi:glycosyltransferase [Methylobacterium sp. WSM2598]|uniref:glycosyltransferase n=1 Tax=Methylobacterium sp. WSM2598 TaxID=398261 RepID=UPI0003820E63|nr:glycosyltransferase [Methylobacterium sp. WSM2598]
MTADRGICLCMIVKDEAPVIRRCLDSVRPLIDHWVVVDTGSTDGTQEIVRDALAGLPGALVERPWRDFAHNRSEALDLARPRGAYSLIIDADDTLEIPDGFVLPPLDADSYTLDIRFGAIAYRRPQLVRNALPWRYRGVLHEFLACEEARSSGHLPLTIRVSEDGRRRRDPATYRRDAAVLEQALAAETDPFLVARYTFYLAQTYRDCGAVQQAVEAYLRRATLGFWEEEVFVSLYQAGRLMEALRADPDEILAVYRRAGEVRPGRVEAAHAASRFCRGIGRNRQGHAIAKEALGRPAPADGLFVERWIYAYGLADEYAINAYWAGAMHDCIDGCLRALHSEMLPAADRERILRNLRFAASALEQAPPRQPSPPLDPPAALRPLRSRLPEPAPRVLLAVLAKQKEPVLDLYLDCIEALDYPKSSIVLCVRTNNNTDRTGGMLRAWLDRVGGLYAGIVFDDADVPEPVQDLAVHEWTPQRFAVLGAIRQRSLALTLARDCAFYFVADADNFLIPSTLRDLVSLNLPIVAPMLREVKPGSRYANFHAAVDAQGYFAESRDYDALLERRILGVVEVPVVHCTYLVRADAIPLLRYEDGSGRHEYVVFSDHARRRGIPQYLDNRRCYGCLTLEDDDPEALAARLPAILAFLREVRAGDRPEPARA